MQYRLHFGEIAINVANFRMTRRRLSEAMANSAFEKQSLNSQGNQRVSNWFAFEDP
jgi:hypothetical protein